MNILTREQYTELQKIALQIKEIVKDKVINCNFPIIDDIPKAKLVSENDSISESILHFDTVNIRFNYTPPKAKKFSFKQRIRILFKGE
jgi:hypothetical protein